ncbi:MAG: Wadjet anti-phage system protein JetA family protein [Clostridium sp.]
MQEHLDGYVEEIVRKKYHILKTSGLTFTCIRPDINVAHADAPGCFWLDIVCAE